MRTMHEIADMMQMTECKAGAARDEVKDGDSSQAQMMGFYLGLYAALSWVLTAPGDQSSMLDKLVIEMKVIEGGRT